MTGSSLTGGGGVSALRGGAWATVPALALAAGSKGRGGAGSSRRVRRSTHARERPAQREATPRRRLKAASPRWRLKEASSRTRLRKLLPVPAGSRGVRRSRPRPRYVTQVLRTSSHRLTRASHGGSRPRKQVSHLLTGLAFPHPSMPTGFRHHT